MKDSNKWDLVDNELALALRYEAGCWTARRPFDKEDDYKLTWWPEGWMTGRAYYTFISWRRCPKKLWRDLAREEVRVAIMAVKIAKDEYEQQATPDTTRT